MTASPPPAVRAFFLVNEGLAFLLEVVALGLLAWWGSTRGLGWAGSLALAVAAPLGAAVLWGMFAIPYAAQLGVKAGVFGAAALALLVLGHRSPFLWFTVAVVLNTALASYHRTRSRRAGDRLT
ncbi:hypothetical protein RVR_9391 [Actinacidiphila reveromycinica]|uniref:DUF2568 domain-containing protein n=1 Tax=Actinacidiphila reveromycinica TaxID=659352 RepID=A0A7U3VSJ9_9ACTN|nr:YrdB family protein [Streptomyces sp. SN-593]BBB01810.1 hypothetical protein RVR_9391 [Streptomyces sp. SN-593]